MPTTTNRGYEVPVTGTAVDLWGDILNDNFGLLDSNLGAVATIALSSSNVTLSASEAACGTIALSGGLGANCLVLFPNVQGWWTVRNLCTGNFYAAVRRVGGGNQIAIPPGEAVDVYSDGTNFGFRNLGVPIGGYWDYAGSGVPLWVSSCSVPPFLLCDGSTFSAATYPYLNGILGGNTLPDTRGRARFNLDGGTSRITTAGSGIDGSLRFAAGGAQNVTLDATMIPSHTHAASVTDPGHTHGIEGVVQAAGSGGASGNVMNSAGSVTNTSETGTTGISVSNANTGGGLAHNNMPPAVIGGVTMIRAA